MCGLVWTQCLSAPAPHFLRRVSRIKEEDRMMAAASKGKQIKAVSSRQRKIRNNLIAYSFIAPNFIGFAVLTLVPIIAAVGLSFASWNGSTKLEWVGLQNYARLFTDRIFKQSFVNTLIYSAATVPLTIIASLLLAILLNQKIAARNFFRTVSFFPYVASMVAVAAVWNALFDPNKGMVNQMLMGLSIQNPPRWIADPHWAMVDIILFSVWKMMGYYMVIYLAGLRALTRSFTRPPDWMVRMGGRSSGM